MKKKTPSVAPSPRKSGKGAVKQTATAPKPGHILVSNESIAQIKRIRKRMIELNVRQKDIVNLYVGAVGSSGYFEPGYLSRVLNCKESVSKKRLDMIEKVVNSFGKDTTCTV